VAMTILSNPLAIAAQRHLSQTEGRYNTSIVRMASGTRITQAADDPAGLAISDNMTSTIRSLEPIPSRRVVIGSRRVTRYSDA